jgi:hypothetical protein
MRSLCLCLLLLAAAAPEPGAAEPAGSLDDALAARAMLGADTWARVVRIENSRPAGVFRRGSYPRVVYAVVFELSGILWFYTDVDGTQSLSLTRGTVARDESDPGPLFRAIDPGFTAWSWVGVPPDTRSRVRLRPRNACFEESVGALRRRLAGGGRADSPSLLSYYVDTPVGRLGHTVLVFGTASGLLAVDADESDRPIPLPPEVGADPLAISAYLRGGPVSAARTIPIAPAGRADRWAAIPARPGPAG